MGRYSKMRFFINNKFKAFTLAELLIAALLASLVVGLCGTSYLLMTRRWKQLNQVNSRITYAALLQQTLSNEFDHADSVLFNDNQIMLFYNGHETFYQILDSLIVRSSIVNDTFRFKPGIIFIPHAMENAIVLSSIILVLPLTSDTVHLSFRKDYAADVRLKIKTQ